MNQILPSLTVLSLAVSVAWSQDPVKPGTAEANGLTPKTATIYINVPATINNANTESLGVAIASNGNILIGWEDDGDGVTDLESVWTLFDANGNSITPDTQITASDGQTLTSKFLSFFRSNGTPIPGNTAWGPKIKANPFGDGLGMGATAFGLGLEVPEFAAINLQADGEPGDFPATQLMGNDGKPIAILTGVSDADADPTGDIRIADWDYLSNGNVVIVGESRQQADLETRFGGAAPGNHATYRIVDKAGNEVKSLGLVSEIAEPNEIWHGVGVTQNGFAVRFAHGGQGTIRLFDNQGAPLTGNIDLGTLTEEPANAGGGRGDGTGFHGNGKDAYVAVNASKNAEGFNETRVTVINADGTLRWSRVASDDIPTSNTDRVDAAIDPLGRVLVAFSDKDMSLDPPPSVVVGRLFDAAGQPLGGTFYASERETGGTTPDDSTGPRVAWRDNLAVIIWESKSSGAPDALTVVAARVFSTAGPAAPALTIASSGAQVILSWPASTTGAVIQSAEALSPSAWTDLTPQPPIVVSGDQNTATLAAGAAARFYRLRL